MALLSVLSASSQDQKRFAALAIDVITDAYRAELQLIDPASDGIGPSQKSWGRVLDGLSSR